MATEDEKNLIEAANAAAKRLEDANRLTEELVKRQEAMEARRILGGQTEAGQAKEPEVPKEERDKADMKNYFKGTSLERAFK